MAQENCCNLEDFIKVGPWGSQGGTHWSFKPKGLISEIIISHGWLIDSISFKSEDGTDDTIEYSSKFGGDGGKTEKISLDTPREYLTSITGTHDAFNYIVQSLYFYTNRTKYGPFGSSKLGTSFNLPMEGGVIVGFHGRSSALLDAIGVYVKRAADVLPLSCSRQGQMATNKQGCGNYEFFRWSDPSMCARSKVSIPGLLRRIRDLEMRLLETNGFEGPDTSVSPVVANEEVSSRGAMKRILCCVVIVAVGIVLCLLLQPQHNTTCLLLPENM